MHPYLSRFKGFDEARGNHKTFCAQSPEHSPASVLKPLVDGVPIEVRKKRVDLFGSLGGLVVEPVGVLPNVEHDHWPKPAMLPVSWSVIQSFESHRLAGS